MSSERLPRLIAITDRTRFTTLDHALTHYSALAHAGLPAIQLREKDLDARELLPLAQALRQRCPSTTRLFVNGHLDIARALHLDLHLPQDDPALPHARSALHNDALLSVSAHSLEAARAAQRAGADLLLFSPVFSPSYAPHTPGVGLEALERVAGAVSVPVWALGGVTPERTPACLEAGAYGIAAIGAWMEPGALARFGEHTC